MEKIIKGGFIDGNGKFQSRVLLCDENGLLATGTYSKLVVGELTRASDTNAYVSGDAVTTHASTNPAGITFANAARKNGGEGWIIDARILTNNTTWASKAVRLWLFNANPTIPNDNAPFGVVWNDRAKFLGYIDMTFEADAGGTGVFAQTLGVNLKYTTASDSAAIFGVLQVKAAANPTSGQLFYVQLGCEQN